MFIFRHPRTGFGPAPSEYQGITLVESCVCSGGRFDLDEFGRVHVPDQIRCRVTALDAAGDVLFWFGRYGNRDAVSRDRDVFLCDPRCLAAASDRVSVGEGNPNRIPRIRLEPRAQAEGDVWGGR